VAPPPRHHSPWSPPYNKAKQHQRHSQVAMTDDNNRLGGGNGRWWNSMMVSNIFLFPSFLCSWPPPPFLCTSCKVGGFVLVLFVSTQLPCPYLWGGALF
jgi:hypothetical protein